MAAPPAASGPLTIVVKSVYGCSAAAAPNEAEFALEAGTTVAQLKALCRARFAGAPPVALQRLIFCGKVCADASSLGEVCALMDRDAGKQTFHLVVSSGASPVAKGGPPVFVRTPPGAGAAPVVPAAAPATPPLFGAPHPDPARAAAAAAPRIRTPLVPPSSGAGRARLRHGLTRAEQEALLRLSPAAVASPGLTPAEDAWLRREVSPSVASDPGLATPRRTPQPQPQQPPPSPQDLAGLSPREKEFLEGARAAAGRQQAALAQYAAQARMQVQMQVQVQAEVRRQLAALGLRPAGWDAAAAGAAAAAAGGAAPAGARRGGPRAAAGSGGGGAHATQRRHAAHRQHQAPYVVDDGGAAAERLAAEYAAAVGAAVHHQQHHHHHHHLPRAAGHDGAAAQVPAAAAGGPPLGPNAPAAGGGAAHAAGLAAMNELGVQRALAAAAVARPGLLALLDVRLALKMGVLILLLGQDGNPTRLLMLTATAGVIYFVQTGLLAAVVAALLAALWEALGGDRAPVRAAAGAAAAAGGGGAAAGPAAPAETWRGGFVPAHGGVGSDVFWFCTTFVCSLWPGWRPRPRTPPRAPEPAAAAAAAAAAA